MYSIADKGGYIFLIIFLLNLDQHPMYQEGIGNLVDNPRIGEPDDLARNVQAPVPAPPPVPIREELDADGAQANAAAGEGWGRGHVVQAHLIGQAQGEAEEANWNPMEWDRPAEELTWERLLGLDGSLVFLEHVFWVVSLNTLFIMVSLCTKIIEMCCHFKQQ